MSVDRLTRADIEENYLRCRTWGHQWEAGEDLYMRKPQFGQRETLLCLRCTTRRHTLVNTLGDVLSRQYVYPEGYKANSEQKPSRAMLRLEVIKRWQASQRARTNGNGRSRRTVSVR